MEDSTKRPPNPTIVVAAVAFHRGKVLMMRRRPEDSYPGSWEFPGGKVEEGESYEAALERELLEELEEKAKIIKPIAIGHTFKGDRWIQVIGYKVEFHREPKKSNDHDLMKWVTLKDLLALPMGPANFEIATQVLNRSFELSRIDTWSITKIMMVSYLAIGFLISLFVYFFMPMIPVPQNFPIPPFMGIATLFVVPVIYSLTAGFFTWLGLSLFNMVINVVGGPIFDFEKS